MKYNSTSKYKVQCRAILKNDFEVTGNHVEKLKTDWLKRFEGRKDIQPYFMINEIEKTTTEAD